MTFNKPVHVKPQFYANCFQYLKDIALKHGYNLLLSGSVNRDFDLVAVPWDEAISPHEVLIQEFLDFLGGHILVIGVREDDNRAIGASGLFDVTHHGRIRYVINLNRGGKWNDYRDEQYYLDISITPIINKNE